MSDLTEIQKSYVESVKEDKMSRKTPDKELILHAYLYCTLRDFFPLEELFLNIGSLHKYNVVARTLLISLYLNKKITDGFPEKGLEICMEECRRAEGKKINQLPTVIEMFNRYERNESEVDFREMKWD